MSNPVKDGATVERKAERIPEPTETHRHYCLDGKHQPDGYTFDCEAWPCYSPVCFNDGESEGCPDCQGGSHA